MRPVGSYHRRSPRDFGKVRWEVIGSDSIPAEASRLHGQAREAGGRGDYKRALSLLEQAHRLAPEWPYPVYDAAFTYLLQGDSTKAEEHYAEVDRLAPRGFFTAKTSLDCLRREHAGVVPRFLQGVRISRVDGR